jgi:hypothetical protein
MLSAATGQAATVTVLNGTAQVNRGRGYEPIAGTSEVAPGDFILVSVNGQANINYGAGCNTVVSAGAVAVVLEQPPCEPLTTGAVNEGGPSYAMIGVGALAIAGGIGLAVVLSSDREKKDKPASP